MKVTIPELDTSKNIYSKILNFIHMKTLIILFAALICSSDSFAQYYYTTYTSDYNTSNTYQYKDAFNNSYKSYDNLWKDSDNDGYINYYDRHDTNPNVGYNSTPTMNYPSYYSNYNSSTYSPSSGRTIYEGSRGGNYYINSNGNKTYIKKETWSW